MTYNKHKSSYNSNILTPKKIGFIIEDLKENCSLCKKEISHNCCISIIITEWVTLKNQYGQKRSN